MEIINSLKAKIGRSEEEKISQFLGESTEAVKQSLDLSLNAMLGGLREISKKEGDASRVLKVINDGGHSGDLTDDLSRLFSNPDKVQLLITIGKNISNHFFNGKADALIEKISVLGAVSRTSASSLFSLAAPLVLGALGKTIRLEGLNVAGFTAKLQNEQLSLSDITSNILLNCLGFTPVQEEETPAVPIVNTPVSEVKLADEEIKATGKSNLPQTKITKKKEKSRDTLNWVAWVILAFLGAAVLYYSFKDKYYSGIQSSEEVSGLEDSVFQETEDMFDALDTDRNKTNIATENQLESNPNTEIPKEGVPVLTEPEVIRSPAEAPVVRNTPQVSAAPEAIAEPPAQNVSRDTRPMSVKLGSSTFVGINGLSFKNNSGEIDSRGSLSQVVKYLKDNPTKNIEIVGSSSSGSLAEDRAYGLQGALYDAGISSERMKVLTQNISGDGPVVVRVR